MIEMRAAVRTHVHMKVKAKNTLKPCMITSARRRTYRQRKKVEKKPCMKNPDALSCAIRHTRCLECPYNYFFKPDRRNSKFDLPTNAIQPVVNNVPLAARCFTAARSALLSIFFFAGFTFSAGVSTAMLHGPPNLPPAHPTASHMIEIQKPPVDYSAGLSKIPFATFDVGSMGGLTPDNWGVPYNGKNPGMALFMASAGVTLRMVINVGVIYCIYTNWINSDEN